MDHIEVSTTEALDNNQENNLLLNAIKNKFASATSEAASFSPPKFNIPTLKIAGNAQVSSVPTNLNGANNLNQFLLKQLQETQSKNEVSNKGTATTKGFVLPNLNTNDKQKIGTTKFEIPLLGSSTGNTHSSVSSLTTAINKLKVKENVNTSHPAAIPATIVPAIDLTSALSFKSSHQGTPPTRVFPVKQKQTSTTDFDIPFIDCDRLDTSAVLLAKSNEYCQIDISQLSLNPTFVQQPSVVGQFMCIADKGYTVPLKCLTSIQQYKKKVKHVIKPFYFDTKSPDDIVLESLNKYQRRYLN